MRRMMLQEALRVLLVRGSIVLGQAILGALATVAASEYQRSEFYAGGSAALAAEFRRLFR